MSNEIKIFIVNLFIRKQNRQKATVYAFKHLVSNSFLPPYFSNWVIIVLIITIL